MGLLAGRRLLLLCTVSSEVATALSKRLWWLSSAWIFRAKILPRLPRGLIASVAHGGLNFAADLRHGCGDLLAERGAIEL